MSKVTTKMARAAMNAGEMPDIGNAFAAVGAALDEMESAPRWLLNRDDDGHWYLMHETDREAFERYVMDNGPEPASMRRINHPNTITFTMPEENGLAVETP